jgi:bifunctional DNA-binding transcriptional regulator/antitoxin component of YhaV-PrlF toxin-antitoxin module
VSEDGPEEIQVLTVRGNKLYLPIDVRTAFNLHNEDRVVVYNDKGRMSVKIIRKSKASARMVQAKV